MSFLENKKYTDLKKQRIRLVELLFLENSMDVTNDNKHIVDVLSTSLNPEVLRIWNKICDIDEQIYICIKNKIKKPTFCN